MEEAKRQSHSRLFDGVISTQVEWAPVGAKKCLVARVEILMSDDGAPKMTSFLVEDLDEVLELSD